MSGGSPTVADVFVADDRVIYSASDLAAAARCEYALLRSFDARLGWGPPVAVEDELLARTAELGGEHEQRHLDELRAMTHENVAVIGRPDYTVAGLTAAAEATLRAVERRAPVIYQAAMFDGRFVGFADFLVFDGERYRLARHQAGPLGQGRGAAAARGVRRHPGRRRRAGGATKSSWCSATAPPSATASTSCSLCTGRGARRCSACSTAIWPAVAAVSWEDENVRACFRCPECAIQVRAHDDLLLVAGMRASQRARLIDAGITTMTELARHDGPVPELPAQNRRRADRAGPAADRAQGRRQAAVRGRRRAAADGCCPTPTRATCSSTSRATRCGRPTAATGAWSTCGACSRSAAPFRPLWAHDRASERQALVDFLAMVRKRRKRYPNMHIYHYAAYEKTALLRLAGRYGVGEDEVDDLLRNGILVDLYPLVRKSIRVGAENYSIKSLEPLYMGAELRDRRCHDRRRLDQPVRTLLRPARRRPRRRGRRSC